MTAQPSIGLPANLARYLCRVLGVIFVATAPFVFLSAEAPMRYHTLLHVVTGLVALGIGFWGTRNAARLYCLLFGAGYLLFGVLGMLLGDPADDRMWHVGPLELMTGDHVFHIVLGAVVLLTGILTRVRAAGKQPARAASRR